METKKNGYNTGIASEYLVLSMLYRLDAKAYMTLGNEKRVDIRIAKTDGSWISVDVKSVRSSDSIPVSNVEPKDGHYIIFVIYNNKFELQCTVVENSKKKFVDPTFPDFYIVPSKYVAEKKTKYKLKNGGERFNIFKKDIVDYKNKWEQLGLSE